MLGVIVLRYRALAREATERIDVGMVMVLGVVAAGVISFGGAYIALGLPPF